MKNNKVLVICGQTATGKTKLGIELAKKFNGEIISADSRQVYCEMDIGTGKDLSEYKNIKHWGIDLVNPNQEYSVSEFRKYALSKIKEIHSKNKLPIIVGGTGFYIDAIFSDQELIDIPKNERLRSDLQNKNSEDLFSILKNLDKNLANSLNNSEKNNKQRLIRRIEILKSKKIGNKNINNNFEVLYIGLKLEKSKLIKIIENRIKKRVDQGFEKELNNLVKKYGKLEIFIKTPGYKDWPNIENWLTSEVQYSKRQLTWFMKNKKINWFEADSKNLKNLVENLVSKWYSRTDNAKKD